MVFWQMDRRIRKGGTEMNDRASKGHRGWYVLLLIPFVATLYPPFYASDAPELWGIPFFYWYQFLWVLISVVLTAIVYFATRSR